MAVTTNAGTTRENFAQSFQNVVCEVSSCAIRSCYTRVTLCNRKAATATTLRSSSCCARSLCMPCSSSMVALDVVPCAGANVAVSRSAQALPVAWCYGSRNRSPACPCGCFSRAASLANTVRLRSLMRCCVALSMRAQDANSVRRVFGVRPGGVCAAALWPLAHHQPCRRAHDGEPLV